MRSLIPIAVIWLGACGGSVVSDGSSGNTGEKAGLEPAPLPNGAQPGDSPGADPFPDGPGHGTDNPGHAGPGADPDSPPSSSTSSPSATSEPGETSTPATPVDPTPEELCAAGCENAASCGFDVCAMGNIDCTTPRAQCILGCVAEIPCDELKFWKLKNCADGCGGGGNGPPWGGQGKGPGGG